MVVWNEENLAHLLSRAGFGASARDIPKYLRYGHAVTVEKLITVRPSLAKGPGRDDATRENRVRLQKWWAKRMLKASNRRVQEKMTLFWHDHFACNTTNNAVPAIQNQTFRFYGLGSFRVLVYQMTKDPLMLNFLDGARNTVGKPNENYARELMELFTLGVTDLNGVPNYTQTDVQELARSLTGFTFDGVFDPSQFDGGTKTVFAGKSYQATGNLGVEDGAANQLPAARNVLDILFTHRDSDGALTIPRFITKKLWEYLAYPAPTKALLDELAAPFTAGSFLITDLLRAIFLHDEFYSDTARTSSVRNPCEFAFHAMRALEVKTDHSTLPDQLSDMGMDLFNPPTVNGWDNGLAWLSSGQFLARLQFAQAMVRDDGGKPYKLQPSKLYDPFAPFSAATVVDGLLERLHIADRMPAGARQQLITFLGTDPSPLVFEPKIRGVLAVILALPEPHIH